MDKLIRKATYGPGKCCTSKDATQLKEAFGFAGELKNFSTLGRAAMFRALRHANQREGSLHILSRCDELQFEYRTTLYFCPQQDLGGLV